MFGQGYYSIQEIRESGPRALFDDLTTPEQRLEAFEVYHGHAGTYERHGDRLSLVPSIAKGPNTMHGTAAEYVTELRGDTLIITRGSDDSGRRRITVLHRVE
jgi:hypothetical protein